MRVFQTQNNITSIDLLNEKKEIIGEIVFGFIMGFNERIKINSEVYKVKNTGFLWNEVSIFDKNEKLILKTDSSKNRIFHYADSTEIYTYEYKGWFHKKLYLYDNDDRQVVCIDCKEKLFGTDYILKIENDFDNYLIALSFLSFYIRSSSN